MALRYFTLVIIETVSSGKFARVVRNLVIEMALLLLEKLKVYPERDKP